MEKSISMKKSLIDGHYWKMLLARILMGLLINLLIAGILYLIPGYKAYITKTIFDEHGLNFSIPDILMTQISITFIITSLLSVLSSNSIVVFWEDVMARQLIYPKYTNFISLSGYLFASLISSFISLTLFKEYIVISFILSVIVAGYLSAKTIGIYYGKDEIKKQLKNELKLYHEAASNAESDAEKRWEVKHNEYLNEPMHMPDKNCGIKVTTIPITYEDNEKEAIKKYHSIMDRLIARSIQVIADKNIESILDNQELFVEDREYEEEFIELIFNENTKFALTLFQYNGNTFLSTDNSCHAILIYCIKNNIDLPSQLIDKISSYWIQKVENILDVNFRIKHMNYEENKDQSADTPTAIYYFINHDIYDSYNMEISDDRLNLDCDFDDSLFKYLFHDADYGKLIDIYEKFYIDMITLRGSHNEIFTRWNIKFEYTSGDALHILFYGFAKTIENHTVPDDNIGEFVTMACKFYSYWYIDTYNDDKYMRYYEIPGPVRLALENGYKDALLYSLAENQDKVLSRLLLEAGLSVKDVMLNQKLLEGIEPRYMIRDGITKDDLKKFNTSDYIYYISVFYDDWNENKKLMKQLGFSDEEIKQSISEHQ